MIPIPKKRPFFFDILQVNFQTHEIYFHLNSDQNTNTNNEYLEK